MIGMTVFDAIFTLLKHQQSFVAYRMPGDTAPELLYGGKFSKEKPDPKATNLFIFSPFIESESYPELVYKRYQKFFSRSDFYVDESNSNHVFWDTIGPNIINKTTYLEKVKHLIDQIKHSELDKIVFSRVISKEIVEHYNWAAHFERLCQKYPDAFVYFIALEKKHFWIGATPEILVSYENGLGETMALAGTQPIGKSGQEYSWKQKEIDEQGYVRRTILETLQQFNVKWLHQSELKTKTAGQVAHLVNHFRFSLSDSSPLSLARALHPTPAVCGQPKQKASTLITKTESHSRAYYSGYLGTIDPHGNTRLFVNLRCMQIINEQAYIYVGGGITADSNPEKEWEETALKAQTMLAVFQNKY